jgi:hypothetical protein
MSTLASVNKQLVASKSLRSFWIGVSKGRLLDRLLLTAGFVAEYALGIHIGYAIGWVTGLYAGRIYAEHFGPVYLEDLSQLSSLLSYWGSVPYVFARNGAYIGAALGVIAIAIIHARSRKECKSDEHTRHLCHYVSYGHHVNNEVDFRNLVKEPRYRCNLCGLTANLKESVCSPAEL